MGRQGPELKKKPPKVVQLEVHRGGKGDEHWNRSIEGVLRRALEEHEKHGYTDIAIVGLRSEDGVARPDVYSYSRDKLRVLGLLKWATDIIVGRFRS